MCRSLTTMTEMALTMMPKSGTQDSISTMVQHLWQHPQVQHVRKVVYSVNMYRDIQWEYGICQMG